MSEDTNLPPAGPESESGSVQGQPASSARERTLRHMRKLLANAAFAGVVLETAGCPPVVCDPLPPPVTCADGLSRDELSWAVWSQARWTQETGGLMVQLQVWSGTSNLTFTGTPTVENGTLDRFLNEEYQITLNCIPAQGVTAVTVSIPLKCDSNPAAALLLELNVSGAPAAGNAIPVTVRN